jgi:GNAT superfamily N-acetyltransferase
MNGVVIRRAKRSDYSAICELFRQGDAHHARAQPGEYRVQRGPSRPRKYIDRLIDDRDTLVLLATKAERTVGIAVANVMRIAGGPRVRKKIGIVDSVVVDRSHRRKGVGSLLMNELEAWAKKRRLVDLRLNVIDANRGALAFYAALGYEPLFRRLVKKV